MVNIKKIEVLTKKGLMKPEGIAAFEQRKENKSGIYSHEKETVQLEPKLEKKFKANKKAWSFFQAQAVYYRKRITNWIMSAKRDVTKLSRLKK